MNDIFFIGNLLEYLSSHLGIHFCVSLHARKGAEGLREGNLAEASRNFAEALYESISFSDAFLKQGHTRGVDSAAAELFLSLTDLSK